MRLATGFVSLLLIAVPAAAQHFHHHVDAGLGEQFRRSPCAKEYTKPPLDAAWQKVTWEPTSQSADARKYFRQGMTQYYAFNFEESARNFRAALQTDPAMAMAAWGIALASGPNININMQGKCAEDALHNARLAVELAKKQPGITAPERGLIEALDARYGTGALDPVAYAVGLRRVWTNAKSDPDITAAYAESLMDLRPWGLFDNALRPALDTHEIIGMLQFALKAHDHAIGANHLLIHAVEAGPSPSTAQHSADILAGLVPASGHLNHMPSHINLLVGNYAKAVENNTEAADVDKRDYAAACAGSFDEYWANPNCPAVYYGHYLGHNYFFRSVAAAFAGMSKVAIEAANDTNAHVQRFVANEPGLQRYLATPMMMLAAHQRWDAVMAEPEPDDSCYAQKPFLEPTGCHILRAVFFYARGMALASRVNLDGARRNYNFMLGHIASISPPTPTGWGNNAAAVVLAVPTDLLRARIAWAENKKDEAIEHLKLAVTHEDAMVYDEPPQWFAPARESLGGAYLKTAQYGKAVDTFHTALEQHPKSGRALYGLMRACEKATKPNAKCPADVEEQFQAAWKHADYAMDVDRLW